MSPSSRLRPRTAHRADLPALLALEARFPGDRLSRRQFLHHLRSPASRLRVLDVGGEVAGYALCLRHPAGRIARLYSITVAPELRGQGAGRLLLRDAEAGARGWGCELLRLEVRADNVAAIALYRGAGYGAIGRRPHYYEDGADALRFEQRLRPRRA